MKMTVIEIVNLNEMFPLNWRDYRLRFTQFLLYNGVLQKKRVFKNDKGLMEDKVL